MNETMLTTLYCIIDDFINALVDTDHDKRMNEFQKENRLQTRRLT